MSNWHSGVDLNRNYPVCFDTPGDGSSTRHCDEDYRGAHPFSEPETIAVRDFLASKNVTIAFNFHSYGHLMLIPYSCKSQGLSDKNEKYFRYYAHQLAYNSKYTVGRSYDKVIKLYPVNGDAADWMFKEHGIFAVSPEVGGNGFWVPANQVEPLSKENIPMCRYGALAAGPHLQIMQVQKALNKNACFSFKVWNEGLWDSWGGHVNLLFTSNLTYTDSQNSQLTFQYNSTKIVPRILAKSGSSSEERFCINLPKNVTEFDGHINIGAADDMQCVMYTLELREFDNSNPVNLFEVLAKRSNPGSSICPLSLTVDGKKSSLLRLTASPTKSEHLRDRPAPKPTVPGSTTFTATDMMLTGVVFLASGICVGMLIIMCHARARHRYGSVVMDEHESTKFLESEMTIIRADTKDKDVTLI